MARAPKSAGRGSPAPLAASPAQDAHTHKHSSVARETVKLTTSLVSRPYEHMSGTALTNAPPLVRPIRTYPSVQTSQHPAVLPIEQGNDCQAAQEHYAKSCQSEHVSTFPGVASVAASPNTPSPVVCNNICITPDVTPIDTHESGPRPMKPLPPFVAMALAKYRREKCRKGIRIRPWGGPVRPDVPLPASRANEEGQLR